MGSGGDLGRGGSVRKCKRVNVHFKIPYTTRWGQSLVIIGSDPLLGAWAVKEGVQMTPLQEGDILFWQIVMPVPDHFDTEYSYCVVDENLDTVRRESGSVRSLTIPEGLPQGANVEAHDFWQVHNFRCIYKVISSHPKLIFDVCILPVFKTMLQRNFHCLCVTLLSKNEQRSFWKMWAMQCCAIISIVSKNKKKVLESYNSYGPRVWGILSSMTVI